jgi:YggT family protein
VNTLIDVLLLALQIYSYVLLGRALVSWIPNLDPSNPAVRILYEITEPVLEPIRRLIPPLGGVMDISILVAFFAIILLEQLLRGLV